jgi:CO/xanthine dehydrogenase Mo-binding subunit
MSLIGQSPPRPDGLAKVSGSTRYADDLVFPGMLFGATVRSPHPRARIDNLAVDRAAAPPGVVFVTAADLPGPNGVQLITDDWPILAAGETHHVGEPVALVAAPSRLAALRARHLITIDYTPLEPILDLEEAARHPPLCALAFGSSAVEAALAAAEVVVEGTYRTGYQEHIYIECQAVTAWFDETDRLNVVGTMQCPYYVHKSLVHAFGLPAEQVRVQASAVGGGFGGKEDYPSLIAIHAALLARASGKPVRLAYDRHEDIIGTTKRHPAVVRHRTAVARDGTLEAMDIDVTLDGGAYATLSSVVLSRALLHAAGAYRCPQVRIRGRALRTHTATNGAFRGFGAPQTLFAVERQMDRIARRLGLDPLEIRLRNALEAGDALPTGQILDATTSARLCLERAAAKTDFQRRWRAIEESRAVLDEAAPRPGLGLALYFHGAGFTGNGERRMRSPVRARLLADGRLEIQTAMTDMGQGCAAIFPQMAQEGTGLSAEDLSFALPDTAQVPDSGPTVASRTTMVVGGALVAAGRQLRDAVLGAWQADEGLADGLTIDEGIVTAADGRSRPFRQIASAVFARHGALEVTHRHEPPADQEFDETTYQGSAYPTYAWGANVVEVLVDPDTLAVRPQKVTAVCEVGRAIHPTLCKGQIEGGVLQAVAWGLMEEIKVDGGRYLNDRLATYIIPTAKDAPELDVELLERPWAGGPFGAKGVGELPMDGGAPAVLAAIDNALGLELTEIPATPERLFAAGQERAQSGEP